MAASETLSELLIKIRTVGEKEAKEALARAMKAAQEEQKSFKQRLREQQRAEDQRLKELKAARDKSLKVEQQTAKQQLADQKTAERNRIAAQKAADRERVTQERDTQRKLILARKLERDYFNTAIKEEAQRDKEKAAIKRAADRKAADEQKTRDRERIAQEKKTQQELAQVAKSKVATVRQSLDKQMKERDLAAAAGEAGRSAFASGGRKFGDAVVGGALRLGKAATIGAAGLAVGGATAFDRFLERADKLKSVAAFTSMTTERLQELTFAFEQNGVSGETFADGIRQFNAGVRESAKGGGTTGAVAEGVKDMGLSFKELIDMSPEEQFFSILKRANELGPSMHRAGVFAKVFGETAGAAFARIADQGTEAISSAAKSAKDLGFVLESATVNQAVKVKQQLDGTMALVGGVKNSILAEFLPAAERYIGVVREWILVNKDLVKPAVVEWFSKVEQAAKAAWPDVKALLKVAAELVPVLISWGPALLEVGLGLKGLGVAQQAASSIKTLSGAFMTAQGSAAAFAGAGGIGAITQAMLILLPIAWKVGEALGDIGNQNTGPRSTLAQKLLAAPISSFGVAGGEAYSAQLSEMSDEKLAAIEREVFDSTRAKDSRARGKLENVFIKARQLKDELAMGNTDSIREGIRKDLSNRKTAKKYSLKDLESLRDQGLISSEEFDLERGARSTGRLTKARSTEKDDKLSDAELMKLIDKATKSGANLQDLIGQRKLAGTTPPVITITQHITNVTASATMNLKMKDGQSAESFGQATVSMFSDWLSTEVRKAIEPSGIAR